MILITGISGNLSSLIYERSVTLGLDVVGGGSKISKDRDGYRKIDFDDPQSIDLNGIKTLLIVSAGYGEDDVVIRRHDTIISAAEAQHVGHVVYTSLSGAGDHLGFALAHRWTERRLQRSGLPWTILRNGLYAELIAALAAPRDGLISAPFGQGHLSPVARADLADAAAEVLSDPARHAGAIYELSGATAWSVSEFAVALGVRYQPVSLEEERLRLATLSLLPFQPSMLMSIYSASAAGFLETETSHLAGLLGRQPYDSLACALETARSA